ncbi:MAG TPA: DNA repair protein RadA [Candidatus Levybacteria bacterium]|nr:DNA repair protein RadA [Candidatus Levybacteria bacterium]
MAKTVTLFVCNECGYESGKWYGKCPECNSWNSFTQVAQADKKATRSTSSRTVMAPQNIGKIQSVAEKRTSTGYSEFDRVLGGRGDNVGMVPGAVMLLSGDPGVGKSTIMLQLGLNLAKAGKTVVYVTGEESESQVKMRAERIAPVKTLESLPLFILATTDIDSALESATQVKPDLVIVDSVQTMVSQDLTGFAGSIPQIRYATSRLVTFAKSKNIPVYLIGHVTKDGMVAGPMMLSHMVDTVLYLEGEPLTGTRILRTFKNRFGDTSEVGIFIMEESGLVELSDASSFFVDKKDGSVPGSCVAVVMEGSRPLLVEIQALVVPSNLAYPRRVANGIAEKRLELLLAVLQKHVRVPIERMDIFVNVVGGLKIQETAVDLAVCLAIVSSFQGKALRSTVAVAEVGLLGEVKHVVNLEKRIKEAGKLGFKTVVSAKDGQFLNSIVKRSIV